jgi:hypothetical protein
MAEPLRLSTQGPPAPKRRKGKVDFSVREALARADEILVGPCTGDLPRTEGRGRFVHRFVLPLDLCKTTNALISLARGATRGQRASRMSSSQRFEAHNTKVWKLMYLQHPTVRAKPIEGRVMLRCVRFTTTAADDAADGMKTAIDFLRVPTPSSWDEKKNDIKRGRRGFGFIVDDSRRYVDRVDWWEKVSPGKGFGLLEIWAVEE